MSPSPPWTGAGFPHRIPIDTVRAGGAGLGAGLGRYFTIWPPTTVPTTAVPRAAPAFITSRRVRVSARGVFATTCLLRFFCAFFLLAILSLLSYAVGSAASILRRRFRRLRSVSSLDVAEPSVRKVVWAVGRMLTAVLANDLLGLASLRFLVSRDREIFPAQRLLASNRIHKNTPT